MTQYQIISNDPGGPTIIRQTVSPRSQALLTPRHRPPPAACRNNSTTVACRNLLALSQALREQRNGGKSHHRQRRCQEADISATPAGD